MIPKKTHITNIVVWQSIINFFFYFIWCRIFCEAGCLLFMQVSLLETLHAISSPMSKVTQVAFITLFVLILWVYTILFPYLNFL